MVSGRIFAQPRSREGEHWAEPLAPGPDDMCGQAGDQCDRTGQAGDDGAVAGPQVVRQQSGKRRERIFAATADGRHARVDCEV